MSAYLSDILGQPQALQSALDGFDVDPLARIAERLRAGEFDRIILTGMGASYYAAYPAWLILAAEGLPAWCLDTSELLDSARPLVTPNTLLWIVSQSGKSPEAQAVLAGLADNPSRLILTTNNLTSPLAQQAGLVVPLHTGEEDGVATRTYVNTLAVTQLAALALTGQDLAVARRAIHEAGQAIERYLEHWEQTVVSLAALLPRPDRILAIGRGASLAAACDGALVLKEAARVNAEGLSTGLFRHGPLELADPRLAVLVLEGPPGTAPLDRRLAQVITDCGARVVWLSPTSDPILPTLPMPAGQGPGRPIAEILSFQLLSIYLARLGGFEPGAMRHMGRLGQPEPSSGLGTL
jgi:glucosamine--fructose-6-phosphate aminotransferase (isomerizing)